MPKRRVAELPLGERRRLPLWLDVCDFFMARDKAHRDQEFEPTEAAGADAIPPAARAAHRVIALLTREQVDYLDKLGKDAQFSSGNKLTRTQILAAMVNAFRRLDLDGEGVRSASQFEQRIVDAMQRGRPAEDEENA